MEFGQNTFSWIWFIWFHEFFWPGLFSFFLPTVNSEVLLKVLKQKTKNYSTLTILSTIKAYTDTSRPCFFGYTCSRYFPVFCAKQFIYGRSCLWWHQMIHYEALFVNWKLYRRHQVLLLRKFNIFSEGNRMHYSKMKALYTYFFARILYGVV